MKKYISFVLPFFCSFSSLAKDCPTGQHWVKSHSRSSYTRADGTFVRATTISSHCRHNRESDNYWLSKFVDSRPEAWPHRLEKSKEWTTEEIERVLQAICELPAEAWRTSKYKIHRMTQSKDGKNPATSADGIVVLYDSAFDRKSTLSRVLAHEFAHEIYNGLIEDKALEYRLATNWLAAKEKSGKIKYYSRKDDYVADDGRVSPEEDFANNVEFFLFDPQKLSKTTPHAFRWIKSYFSDKFKVGSCSK